MTAVAGVVSVVIVNMTGHTFGLVVLVKTEILVMVKGGGFPFIQAMACVAFAF